MMKLLRRIKRFFAVLFGPDEPEKIEIPKDKIISPVETPKEKAPVFFPDISRYELCDFKLFEYDNMITKATEGTSIVDPTLFINIKGCEINNIRLGVYHFYRVNKDPIQQAKFFIKTVGLERLKSMYHDPIVDFETTSVGATQTAQDMKNAIPDLQKFLDYIEKETGRTPIFYSYHSLIRYLNLPPSFSKYKLWIAKYGDEPANLLPWNKYWAWQYSDGQVKNKSYPTSFKGIGDCDSNIFWPHD